MDRLQPVTIAICTLLLAAACEDDPAAAAEISAVNSRVNAIQGFAPKAETPKDFCDAYAEPNAGKPFAFPEVEGQVPAVNAGRWRWINVWATWCKPCVEEIPMIGKLRDKLAGEGTRVDFTLLSVDATRELIESFRAAHAGTPESLRLSASDALAPWLTSLGLGGAQALPIHIFVSPDNQVRCQRLGGIQESDYGSIRRLIRGE